MFGWCRGVASDLGFLSRDFRLAARHGTRQLSILMAVAGLLSGCQAPTTPTVAATPAAAPQRAALPHNLGPYSIHLLSNGDEMELAGDMPEGTAAAVQKLLDAHPSVHVIHLNSDGGELHEGRLLAVLIQQRHLTTYTSTICASACTIAFLAGTTRYLADDAWLGFHSSYDKDSGESSTRGNVVFYQAYHADGLSDAFISKALGTAPNEVWFPSHDELRQAKAVDKFVDRRQFAESGLAYWHSPAEVDQLLKEDNLYAIIAKHDATAYARVQEIYLTGARLGRRITDIEDDAASVIIDQYLPFYVRRAADEPILRYQRADIAKLDYVTEHNPEPCAAQAFPELGLRRTHTEFHLPQSIRHDVDMALADVISSSFEQPHAADTSSDIYKAKSKFYRHLNGSDPALVELIDHPENGRNNPAALCGAVTSFYRDILDQAPADAAIILRDLMGPNS